MEIAVVGATGLVGEAMLAVLAAREFPASKVHALASERSIGARVRYGSRRLTVDPLEDFDFSKTAIALFSAGAEVSADYAPKAAEAGCIVIDNTSYFRNDEDVPLVVPEVNADDIEEFRKKNIIANPNCSTIQLVVALKPIADAAGLASVRVSSYQSVSGAGRAEMEDLARQSIAMLSGGGRSKEGKMAFNVWPQIDVFQDNGYTREEMKIVWETRKILHQPSLAVSATAVRVPVFFGHSESVTIETEGPLSADEARALLANAPGICLMDDPDGGVFPTPAIDAADNDQVFVGRIRDDLISERGLNLWVVADNVRKGAALNSVQIAEILVKAYL